MDRIPVSMVSDVLKHALKVAKVESATSNRVLEAAGAVRWVNGTIPAIYTDDGLVRVHVTGHVYDQMGVIGEASYGFEFPPNASKYETELKRAQNEDRRVHVTFHIVNKKPVILNIGVYAGGGDPSSSKRKD